MSDLSFLKINSLHLQYFEPLREWKILSLKNLREESDFLGHKTVFEKIVRRLEKVNVLKSFREPYSNQKYVYLSGLGAKLLGVEASEVNIPADVLLHDSKLSELIRQMLGGDVFSTFQIPKASTSSIGVDAILKGEKSNKSFSLALELELTRKSKPRINEKIRKYLNSSVYDYVLYVFCNNGVLESYRKTILEEFGANAFSKIFLFYNPTILSREFDISESTGLIKGESADFAQAFLH